MNFKRLGSFILSLMLLAGCSSSGSSGGGSSGDTREWTYMIYMGADNNLSEAGINDIDEMEAVGTSSDVYVVVQGEFSPTYSNVDNSETFRLMVESDDDEGSIDLSNADGIGEVDMASPEALQDFIEFAIENYPANHYALVIWDHGAGWRDLNVSSLTKGAVQDETSGNFMSLPDLATAVRDAQTSTGVTLDIINFDACLMAMYEVTYEFKDLTNFMVFSEETEPGDGDPYDTILDALTADPTMTAAELSAVIVDKYDASYEVDGRDATTKSAVDMSHIDDLDTAVLQLAADLDADSSLDSIVTSAQGDTQEYTYTENHDLYDFCQYIIDNAASSAAATTCATIKTVIDDMVIANETNDSAMDDSHGIAIFLPSSSETNSSDMSDYSALACNATARSADGTWGDFVSGYIGVGGGNLSTATGSFAVQLEWDCNADLDLYVLEPDGNIYAPWMGQTSANGHFSSDSSVSGDDVEYYLADETVMDGTYDILVNYYEGSGSCVAHLSLRDPENGISTFTEISGSPKTMSTSNPTPTDSNGNTSVADIQSNNYSDWWYPGSTTRSFGESGLLQELQLPEAGKQVQYILNYTKDSRLYIGR